LEALLLAKNIPSQKSSNTLLFIDEIQESPIAIQLLRYFYEEILQFSYFLNSKVNNHDL
jgi:predicted AAA+ superfamily ATPase